VDRFLIIIHFHSIKIGLVDENVLENLRVNAGHEIASFRY